MNMKYIGTVIVVAAMASLPAAQAQNPGTFLEFAVPTPSSEPLHVATSPYSFTPIYFTERAFDGGVSGKVGRLDLLIQQLAISGRITEWELPAGHPHFLIYAGTGESIIFGFGVGAAGIGILDTTTGRLKQWNLDYTQGIDHIVKDGNFVYFDEEATPTLGRLNLVTNEITEWSIPGGQPSLNGVDIDPAALRLWTFGGGQVSALDITQNRIRVWNVPGTIDGHIKVHNGAAFFGDNNVGLIGKIDPATNRIESWNTPDPGSDIGDLEVLDRSGITLVEFDETYGNRVGTLDTSTTGTPSVIVPVTSTVTPTRKTIAPTTVQLSSTVTTVTPTRSFDNGQQTGGFTGWIVPTPDSGPVGMAVLPLVPPLPHANAIAFAERTGNKIGLFF